MQKGISVGSVNRGAESCVQRHRMSAGPKAEVWSLGPAFDLDLVKHTSKFPFRGQDASDALKHAQISLVHGVLGGQRRQPWIVRTPGTKFSLSIDLSRRDGIAELHSETRRAMKPHGVHHQMMNCEHVRLLIDRLGQQTQLGAFGHKLMHEYRYVPYL